MTAASSVMKLDLHKHAKMLQKKAGGLEVESRVNAIEHAVFFFLLFQFFSHLHLIQFNIEL